LRRGEHRISEAKAELNRALEFEPQGDGAYATLAGISVNDDRDYATAVSLLNKALSINPRSELTRDYLGVVLLNQGQLDQAVASFREALRINPNYEPAKLHLEFATRNAKP
jgi:tetratricopeptide (TPR) repeat protein